jgi:CheY-like chemotaxis protein
MVKEILVVDDDELMRELVAEWLTADGYRTRTAGNGETALALLREHGAELIITDLYMPKLGGAEAVARMRHEHPDVPLIAMSGHFRSGRYLTPEAVLALGARRALAKPFSRQDLLGAVREVLGQSQS